MNNDAARFLSLLFPRKLEQNEYILIWTKKGDGPGMVKESHWWVDAGLAAHFAVHDAPDKDVYFGVGLSPRDYGPNQRGLARDVAGLGGLWLDIDVQTGVHKNKRLPETIVEAHSLLAEGGIEPSIIVHSGGGLQAYWVFDKFVRFRDDEERQKFAELSAKWIYYFKGLASKHGWEIDSVQDLARVMRVPGTQNWKDPAGPRPVKILELHEELKYEPEYLSKLLDDIGIEVPKKSKTGAVNSGGSGITTNANLTFNPQATYDPDLFDNLAGIEPAFLRAWNHKNSKIKDSTESGYDLSLANYWLNAGFNEQSCVDMLIQHRRKYNNAKTDTRGNISGDYYARTLARARTHTEEDRLEQAKEDGDAPPPTVENALTKLSQELGVEILGCFRVMGDSPHFRVDFEGCSLVLVDSGAIISQTKFREKVATATKKVIKQFSKDRWSFLAQKILDNCEDVAPDPLETGPGWIKYYVKEYLESREVVLHNSLEAVTGDPFIWRDHVWITMPKFQEWVKRKELTGPVKYSESLVGAGFEKDIRNVGESSNSTTRTAWRVPVEVFKYRLPSIDSRKEVD